MRTLAKLYLHGGQYEAVPKALEGWKADHREALRILDLEELIAGCLEAQDQTTELIRLCWELGYSGGIACPEEAGRLALRTLEAGLEAWESLAQAAGDHAQRGYGIAGADRIPAARAEFQELANQLKTRWPFAVAEDVERGAREIAEGRYQTCEDLLRELHG